MYKCTDMFRILRIDNTADMSLPYSDKSGTELMEEEIEKTEQAHRAQKLFDKLVAQKEYKKAEKVAWLLYFNHKIDLFDN